MKSMDAVQSYAALSVLFICFVAFFILLINPKNSSGIYKWIHKRAVLLVWPVAALALLGRIAIVAVYYGIDELIPDALLFRIWAQTVFEQGLPAVYSPEIHAEHGPMLMYFFYVFEAISQFFHTTGGSLLHTILIKMPAMIAECSIGVLIYYFSKDKIGKASAFLLSCFMFLSPAWVIDSSMWGQVDALYSLFIVISFIFLFREKKIIAALFFTMACLFKAQTLFVAPIFGMYYIIPIADKQKRKKAVKAFLLSIGAGVVLFTLLVLPFKEKLTDIWIIDFFNRIMAVKPQNTNGAFNLFGLVGGNCIPDTESFLFLTYRAWGYIFIGLICLASVFLSIKAKDKKLEFLLASFCVASIFFLAHTMNERYILPALALLPFAYAHSKDKRLLAIMLFFTFTATIDQMLFVFDIFGGRMLEFRIFSGLNLACYLYFVYIILDSVYGVAVKLKLKGKEHN